MFHCVTAHCVELGVTGTFMVGKKEKITSEIKFEAFFIEFGGLLVPPSQPLAGILSESKKHRKESN